MSIIEKITSRINPKKSFDEATMLSLIDEQGWQIRELTKWLVEHPGEKADPDEIIKKAIEADQK